MNFTEAYSDRCSTVGKAARTGDLCMLQQLIWTGHPVDVMDNRGWRPIHEAAYHGNSGCLEYLLRQEVTDPNWRTFEEETALLLGARGGQSECVRALLAYGADPNLATKEDFTPISEAVQANQFDCVKLLLKRGGCINHQIYTGHAPLHLAVEKGYAKIVTYLLSHGARLDLCADEDLGPIFLAAQFGHTDILRYLLRVARETDNLDLVNKCASDNASPLLIAAQEGHIGCVKRLLEEGADANIPVNNLNAVPLHYAVYKNRPRCLSLLLPVTNHECLYSADIIMHPLLQSLKHEDTACLKLLQEAGFDFTRDVAINTDNDSLDDDDFINSLFNNYRTCGSLLCNIEPDWPLNGPELLLKMGLSPDSSSDKELPPLIAALVKRAYKLCRLLINYGAKINIYHQVVAGNLAVLLALRNDLDVDTQLCDDSGRRKVFGKYLVPILLAGGEARSCFQNLLEEQRAYQPVPVSLWTALEQRVTNTTNLLILLSFLMCFCTNVTIFRDTLMPFTETEKKQICEIAESTGSLAHACRKEVVLQLGRRKQYTRTMVGSLPIPYILQDYLLFNEYGPLSDIILDAFKHFGPMS